MIVIGCQSYPRPYAAIALQPVTANHIICFVLQVTPMLSPRPQISARYVPHTVVALEVENEHELGLLNY